MTLSVYSDEFDVSGTADYPSAPQFEAPFKPSSIAIVNMDTADAAFASFDGKTDAVRLAAGATITFSQQYTKIWLKRDGAGTPPTNVQIIVER